MYKSTLILFFAFVVMSTSFLEAKRESHHSHKHHYKQERNQPKTQSRTKAKISHETKDHIKDRHWYNASSGESTSHFKSSMTTKKLNELATKTINRGEINSKAAKNGKTVHEYTFHRPIGTNTDGSKAYRMRVVHDGNGNVITAFPVN